jgi:hypothetical protein
MKNHFQSQQGLTLVELAVVITVMGLIIGGVVTGKTLINNSRLNSVMADIRKFAKATEDFEDAYKALPGDIADITSLPAAPAGVTATAGDGNGRFNIAAESVQFWLHLKMANFLVGNYDGTNIYRTVIDGSTGGVPGGKIEGSGYKVTTSSTFGTIFEFVGYSTSPSSNTLAILTPADAKSLDSKMDDGNPSTGTVRAINVSSCFTGVGSASTYTISTSTLACTLQFITHKAATVTSPSSINNCDGSPIGTTRVSTSQVCPDGYVGEIIEECPVTGTSWVIVRNGCELVKCSGNKSYGETRQLPCPEGHTGTIKQTCEKSGNWKNDSTDPGAGCVPSS